MEAVNPSDCEATFRVGPHDEAPGRFFFFEGKATHPTHGEVASLYGWALTRRQAWKHAGDFTEVMDGESGELFNLATQIFNNDMNLLPWLVDGGRRSGTNCWGAELNQGNMVYLKELKVQWKFRKQGLGTWFLQQFLRSPQVMIMGGPFIKTHVFCWPGITRHEVGTNAQVDSFFQKSGFRRIGRTVFMCYSPDPDHPSHRISIDDDATRLEDDFGNTGSLTDEELKAQYPLHVEIASNKKPEIARIIRVAHAVDPSCVRKKGLDGVTPLHMAAGDHNLPALRALLELGGVDDDLQDSANSVAMTPLEMLNETIRSNRLFFETMHIPWEGYSDEELICQYLLKKALNMPGLPSTEAEYVTRNKTGCTCGQCLGGWLSGRMSFLLQVTAGIVYDTGMMNLGDMHGRHSKEDYLNGMMMQFLHPSLHHLVNKQFCQTWYRTFRAVHDILELKAAPYPAQVSLTKDALPYVMKGGKVEYVLDGIIDYAKEQNDTGDFEEDFSDALEKIPVCANDVRFKYVRQKLGLDPHLCWGPYDEEDTIMEDDDDEDEDDY